MSTNLLASLKVRSGGSIVRLNILFVGLVLLFSIGSSEAQSPDFSSFGSDRREMQEHFNSLDRFRTAIKGPLVVPMVRLLDALRELASRHKGLENGDVAAQHKQSAISNQMGDLYQMGHDLDVLRKMKCSENVTDQFIADQIVANEALPKNVEDLSPEERVAAFRKAFLAARSFKLWKACTSE
jgi:hypothetical protein